MGLEAFSRKLNVISSIIPEKPVLKILHIQNGSQSKIAIISTCSCNCFVLHKFFYYDFPMLSQWLIHGHVTLLVAKSQNVIEALLIN